MFEKIKSIVSKSKKMIVSVGVVAVATIATAVSAFAEDTTTGASLLTSDVTSQLSSFAGSLKPTVVGLLAIVIPASLGIWAIGFGIKVGLAKLKGAAKKAV